MTDSEDSVLGFMNDHPKVIESMATSQLSSHASFYKYLMYSITDFFGIFHRFPIRKAPISPL